MNAKEIFFETPSGSYSIPNRWSLLDSHQFLMVLDLIGLWHEGVLSPIAVQAQYVCMYLGLDHNKIDKENGMQNLYAISSAIDFIFEYDKETDEYRLRQPLFAVQKFPSIKIAGRSFSGYDVCTSGGMLSVGIEALPFIDALQLLGDGSQESILRLVLLLYQGGWCSEIEIHKLSETLFPQVLADEWRVIRAVAFQFSALASYIFRLPRYSVLRNSNNQSKASAEYSIGMESSLYHLCADGIGTADEVERLPILQYLNLIRQKLIEGVRSMREMGLEMSDISEKTHIDILTVAKILQ